jgi:hypothetical protein
MLVSTYKWATQGTFAFGDVIVLTRLGMDEKFRIVDGVTLLPEGPKARRPVAPSGNLIAATRKLRLNCIISDSVGQALSESWAIDWSLCESCYCRFRPRLCKKRKLDSSNSILTIHAEKSRPESNHVRINRGLSRRQRNRPSFLHSLGQFQSLAIGGFLASH